MTKQKTVGIRIHDSKVRPRLIKELGNPMGRRTLYGVGLVLWILLLGLSGVCIAEEQYAVKSGDSLSKISKSFGVTVDMLKEANGLKGNALKPKQILIIPTQKEKQAGESRKAWAKNPGKDSGTSKRSLEGKDSYIVQKGDTRQTFAKRAGFVAPVTDQTVIVNETSEDWNSDDQSGLETATNGCARLYKYAVYLKKFIKHKPRNYYAICGEPIITGTME